jgi:phosphatidylethanolamine N-methyltransferase
MFVIIIFYAILLSLLPSLAASLSPSSVLRLHFLHALTWCLMHYVGLGWLLSAQSQNKFLVRHFVKNYYYRDDSEGVAGARVEAFANWKAIYNLSMCMTYGMFGLLSLDSWRSVCGVMGVLMNGCW